MEGFNLLSRSLESNYVFYDRLKDDTDAHKKLYETMRQRVSSAKGEAERSASVTNTLLAQAGREREKEKALIDQFFNGAVNIPWGTPQETRAFIDVINACLNLREVYERNKTLITQTKGQKGVFSFFGTYLEQVLREQWPVFSQQNALLNNPSAESLILNWLGTDIVPQAIEKMFTANPEASVVDPALKNAYVSLLPYIGDITQQGSFVSQLSTIYHLDEIAAELTSYIASDANKIVKKLTTIKANIAYRGGLTLEALGDLIAESISTTGHATIGSLKAKADNMSTFGIDIEPIVQYLESNGPESNRLRSIELFNTLNIKMQGMGEGFIVYTSAKNYTLNKGFSSRGGYSAGSDISLKTYQNILFSIGKNAPSFIGAIQQLADGAVGQDIDPDYFERNIAQDIAYLLFDDFNAIGVGLTNAVSTLHIMNLNGVLVPISSILYALADAINGTIRNKPETIVHVTIKTTPILYPTRESQLQDTGNNNLLAWEKQKEASLRDTEIATSFLSNMSLLLQDGTFR